MLYDALLTVDLPAHVGPPLQTGFWDGAERLLFSGSWSRRAATCTVSSAAVLAGCHAALRGVGERPELQIRDDAGELLDLGAVPLGWGDAPPRWAEILPPKWTDQPCAFRLRASWEEGGFAAVAHLRHTPRHEIEQTALSGSLRVLWSPESTGERLDARLRGEVGTRLARLLRIHGDRVLQALTDALAERFDAAVSHRSRIVVLAGDDFGELLAGFPASALDALPSIRSSLTGWWPALASSGVEGRFRDGRFVGTAEVDHAL